MDFADESPSGAPDWVVTYGDLMSLLLTFFILLFAMSEVRSEDKFGALQASLQRAFGSHVATDSFVHDPFTDAEGPSARGSWLGRIRRSHDGRHGVIEDGSSGEHPRVATVRPGTHWTLGGHVLFAENASELTAEERRTLATIADRIAGKPMKISVRGHTSRRPLATDSPHADDWDLAYARCRSVAEALLNLGIERDRIELDVVGASEPVYTGLDETEFVQNSRVEVFLLDRYAQQYDPAAAEATGADETNASSSSAPARD